MPKFSNEKCVHCLRFCESLTADHVLPESWYPKNTPTTLEKWVVPACNKCNQKLGKIEEDLLLRLGMCVGNLSELSYGITEKILRMINPMVATDKKSYSRKTAALLKMLADLKPCGGGCDKRVLKNANHWHEEGKGFMIRIPQKELVPFVIKMARGLEYKLRGKLVEVGRRITVYRQTQNIPEDAALFRRMEEQINSCLQVAGCGPGFVVNYGVNPHNDENVIYKILIWGKFEVWAQIYPNKMVKKLNKA